MGRSVLFVGVLVGSLALSSTGHRATPVAQGAQTQGAVLLRYRYAPGQTVAYAFRERIVSASATARTTTALLTFSQRLRVTRVSATGVATAVVSESPHTLTTTSGGHRSVVTQPGQPPSAMALYPDGRSSVRAARPTAGGGAVSAPVFPARPVSPGDRWSRSAVFTLGGFTVRPLVIPDTERLTFIGYGVIDGERVAEVTIAVRVQRPGMAPPGGVRPTARVLVTSSTTSTLSIGLASGDQVRVVQDRTTMVRAMTGARSAAHGVLSTLTTHTEINRI